MRSIFDVCPDVRIKVLVDDKKLNVQAERAENATEAARKVHEKSKRQINKRSFELSFGRRREKGTE